MLVSTIVYLRKALEFGLLNEMVQPGEALNAALRLAERISDILSFFANTGI